jgi:hypothetical protein
MWSCSAFDLHCRIRVRVRVRVGVRVRVRVRVRAIERWAGGGACLSPDKLQLRAQFRDGAALFRHLQLSFFLFITDGFKACLQRLDLSTHSKMVYRLR